MSTAVFLSYAREDAEAVRQLTEALRAQGVQVWFDQSELRGADAWDQKIRRQIKECALFVPVISANTQQRGEGYFRLEWKLAVERSHLMAEGMPFLAPVVVDDTSENQAAVPPEFLRVQWTRLPGGQPTPQFVELVKQLLSSPRTAAPWSVSAGPGPADSRPPLRPQPKGGFPGWVWAGLAAVVLGAGLWTLWPKPGNGNSPPSAKTAVDSVVPAKSIAVLPFQNLTADKDKEFFADGMHDEVITALAKIRDLKVISRTSVMGYRNTTGRNLKAIAAELGVAHILEGSVQYAGSQVKVIVQLIDARTDEHLWAETYVEDLANVFAIQSKLATAITGSLKSTLTSEENASIARRPTGNQEAYELYLRSRTLLYAAMAEGWTLETSEAIVAILEQAIARDPGFFLAHVDLAAMLSEQYWFGYLDPSPERKARAKASVEAAQRLAPDRPETHYAVGLYYHRCENDWARALKEYRLAEAGLPNDGRLISEMAFAQRRLGRFAESVETLRRAMALDPRDARPVYNQAMSLHVLRRYEELRDLTTWGLAQFPGQPILAEYLNLARLELDGNWERWLREYESLPPDPSGDPGGVVQRSQTATLRNDLPGADRILASNNRNVLGSAANDTLAEPVSRYRALNALLRGDREAARSFAEQTLEYLKNGRWTRRQESWVLLDKALAQVCAGREDLAVALAREGLALEASRDAFFILGIKARAAEVFVLLGRKDEAFALLREMMTDPGPMGPQRLRHDPIWARVKDDPRFEETLKLAKRL